MKEIVVAIDAGTSGVRSIFFDTEGNALQTVYQEFDSLYPHPSWVEQRALAWWTTACTTMKQCLRKGSFSPEHVVGVCVTNQRETIVPVDESGQPLRDAIVWQDRRTTGQCDWIREQVSAKDIYSITGLTVDPYFSAPKIIWIHQKEPSVFKKAAKFLLVHDFLVYKLTNEFVTDYSNASRTLLFDIARKSWSSRMLDKLDIPKEKLPRAVESGIILGSVSKEASKQCGLTAGTPVVAGGGDQQCAALGVGVVDEGSIKATTGTGTFILAHSREMRLDPQMRVLCSRHVVPDSFVIEASMFTTGSALRWFRDHLATEERNVAGDRGVDPYEIMTSAAESIPAGSEGVIHIPHFVGAGAPYWNPNARGVFAGLALGHTRRHLMRSVLEGVSYEIRSNLEVMKELGIPTNEVRVTGGAAKSDIWMQIQADVLGIPVIRSEFEEATALGAAILACKGVGVFKSVSEAATGMVRPKDILQPSSSNRDVYDFGYARYKQLYEAISGIKWEIN
ncbi:MAG: xylulokinase [Candidatus Thorarchaeota archaeon]